MSRVRAFLSPGCNSSSKPALKPEEVDALSAALSALQVFVECCPLAPANTDCGKTSE